MVIISTILKKRYLKKNKFSKIPYSRYSLLSPINNVGNQVNIETKLLEIKKKLMPFEKTKTETYDNIDIQYNYYKNVKKRIESKGLSEFFVFFTDTCFKSGRSEKNNPEKVYENLNLLDCLQIIKMFINDPLFEIDLRIRCNKYTLFMHACSFGAIHVIRLFLESDRVKLHIPNDIDLSPLDYVCNYGKKEIISTLLSDFRFDPNWKRDGKSVLINACKNGRLEFIEHLLYNKRIDPNITDENGNTPIFHISTTSYITDSEIRISLIKSLINHPLINFKHKNNAGQDILEYLRSRLYLSLSKKIEEFIKNRKVTSTHFSTERINDIFLRICADGHINEIKRLLKKKNIMIT